MTSNPSAGRLPVLVNFSTNESYTLSGASVTLGRAPDNTVVIPDDEYASASHARIYWNNGWWVEDLYSSNGTFVNDEMISAPLMLKPGDVIKIGRTVFRIE
jgi:pSer/pThr/pTyr-binding forkhead associated (FHA) protein